MSVPQGQNATLLSVVLPNYNHGAYLPRALDALLAQGRAADEVLIVDDASTDDSVAIAERYAGAHAEIHLLSHDRNRGVLASLQHGLERAKGRYVYFAAADDYVLPDFFGTALGLLEKHADCGLFCGDAILLDGESGAPIGIRPVIEPVRGGGALSPEEVAGLLRQADNFILTGSAIFRRDLALQKGGFREEAGSFADGMLARQISLSHGLCYWPAAVAVWNVFQESLSRSRALDPDKAQETLHEVPRLLEAAGDFPRWYLEVWRRRWRFNCSRLALEKTPVDTQLLKTMAVQSGLDRAVLRVLIPALGAPGGRKLMLIWLALRFRPLSLKNMIAAALRERSALARARAEGLASIQAHRVAAPSSGSPPPPLGR